MPKNYSEIYLGLGTNLGDRKKNIITAVAHLKDFFKMSCMSSLYETAPRDNINQPFFLNAVISGQTNLEPLIFLEKIKSVEFKMGRNYESDIFKGPRIIDIDILLWHNNMIQNKKLTVPHASICDRAFVLVPLLELNSDLQNPVTRLSYSEHLKRLSNQHVAVFSN